jgi:FPC/CPF motif-containing protein YcgG
MHSPHERQTPNAERRTPTEPIPSTADLVENFRGFVAGRSFPCVGAKSALNRGRMEFVALEKLGTRESAERLLSSLARFSAAHRDVGVEPVSLVVLFESQVAGEDEFHDLLWKQLQTLHELDGAWNPWAAGVSCDPAANDFSFSVASRAFFVVGLHPNASRMARRAPCPALVFNFHDQFQALKTIGHYEKMQSVIRKRDIALQGNINPILARFGESSEALQYSGRASGGCPFRARPTAN